MHFIGLIVVFMVSILLSHSHANDLRPDQAALNILERACREPDKYQVESRANGNLRLADSLGSLSPHKEDHAILLREHIGTLADSVVALLNNKPELSAQCMMYYLERAALTFVPTRSASGEVSIALLDASLHHYRSVSNASNATDVESILRNNGFKIDNREVRTDVVPTGPRFDWEGWAKFHNEKPNLVILHFSAFEYTARMLPSWSNLPLDQKGQCILDGQVNRCVSNFLNFAARVTSQGVPLIVFSKTKNFCRLFRDAVKSNPSVQSSFGKQTVFLLEVKEANLLKEKTSNELLTLTRQALSGPAPGHGQDSGCVL